jgi:hypothetical protein
MFILFNKQNSFYLTNSSDLKPGLHDFHGRLNRRLNIVERRDSACDLSFKASL